MAAEVAQVGVALLNWNQYDDTARCLQSLRESACRPAAIVVLDNGSEDGSGARLLTEFPEITLVRSESNCGFAEGNNRAARLLLDAGMDFIWVLNNDTRVEPDCLGALVQALAADPAAGAVAAKIWFMDASRPLCYAGGTFNRWTFNTAFRGLRARDTGRFDVGGDTEILSGCCMLIRADVLRRIGLFNRDFFAYSEDIDWCLRARAAGIRLRYVPAARMWHRMFGASVRNGQTAVPKSSARVEFLLARNRFLLVRLHTRPGSVRRAFALAYHLFIRRLPRAAGLLLLNGRRAAGLGILKGLWAGLRLRPDPDGSRL